MNCQAMWTVQDSSRLTLFKVWGQKDSSDTGFRAKFNILKLTIPNTVCMYTLQIFPLARELQSIQTSRSRSALNQSCFHCLWLHHPVWKWLKFLYGAPDKNVHDNKFLLLKQPLLYLFVIFKSLVTFIISSTDFPIQNQNFVDFHKRLWSGGEWWSPLLLG